MIREFLAFSCVLCFAAIGAFFLFVPPLLIATALIVTLALLLMGFLLLNGFGIDVRFQSAPPPNRVERKD